jgi:ferredoxin
MGTGIPEINRRACIACGNCVDWCPAGAVALVDGKAVIVDPRNCDYCTDCERVCPVDAIACPFEIILVSDDSGNDARKA